MSVQRVFGNQSIIDEVCRIIWDAAGCFDDEAKWWDIKEEWAWKDVSRVCRELHRGMTWLRYRRVGVRKWPLQLECHPHVYHAIRNLTISEAGDDLSTLFGQLPNLTTLHISGVISQRCLESLRAHAGDAKQLTSLSITLCCKAERQGAPGRLDIARYMASFLDAFPSVTQIGVNLKYYWSCQGFEIPPQEVPACAPRVTECHINLDDISLGWHEVFPSLKRLTCQVFDWIGAGNELQHLDEKSLDRFVEGLPAFSTIESICVVLPYGSGPDEVDKYKTQWDIVLDGVESKIERLCQEVFAHEAHQGATHKPITTSSTGLQSLTWVQLVSPCETPFVLLWSEYSSHCNDDTTFETSYIQYEVGGIHEERMNAGYHDRLATLNHREIEEMINGCIEITPAEVKDIWKEYIDVTGWW